MQVERSRTMGLGARLRLQSRDPRLSLSLRRARPVPPRRAWARHGVAPRGATPKGPPEPVWGRQTEPAPQRAQLSPRGRTRQESQFVHRLAIRDFCAGWSSSRSCPTVAMAPRRSAARPTRGRSSPSRRRTRARSPRRCLPAPSPSPRGRRCRQLRPRWAPRRVRWRRKAEGVGRRRRPEADCGGPQRRKKVAAKRGRRRAPPREASPRSVSRSLSCEMRQVVRASARDRVLHGDGRRRETAPRGTRDGARRAVQIPRGGGAGGRGRGLARRGRRGGGRRSGVGPPGGPLA